MENLAWVPVLSIEPDGEAECICIAVSHPSRLYVTEGGIVTHNTTVDGGGLGVRLGRHGKSFRQKAKAVLEKLDLRWSAGNRRVVTEETKNRIRERIEAFEGFGIRVVQSEKAALA